MVSNAIKPKVKGKYKVKLNSIEKIEEICQIQYDEANQNVVRLQDEINKLASSTNLNECSVDERAKFAKAMNDYITNKDKAIGRKLEIAKLMVEIYKHNGNVMNQSVQEAIPTDWESLKESMKDNVTDTVQKYSISR